MVTDKKMTPKPPPNYFNDVDASKNIKGDAVKGSAVTLVSSIIRLSINIVSTLILARLLDPEAYGLLAMVFVATSFVTLFQDMNLSQATVQKENITHHQISTVYWINVAISFVLALIILAISPAISWFYGEPRLTGIAALLSLSVLIRGFASQHKALIWRKMRFIALAGTQIFPMIVGYATAVYLAWKGYGYWALVWLHVSMAAADLVASWVASGWRPGLPRRGSGVRSMLMFGANLTGYSILRYTSNSMDNAIIGWYWGAAPLGLYSKSRELLGPINRYATGPIGAVAVPVLSRIAQEPERYRNTFIRLMEKIVLVAMPLSVLVAFTADNIVAILLGSKWVEAAPLMQLLAVTIFANSCAGCMNWMFISQGRGGHMLRFGLFDSVIRIAAILIGLSWGIMGIAAAVAVGAVFVRLPIQIWYVCRAGPVRYADVYRTLYPIVLASLAALIFLLLLHEFMPVATPIYSIGLSTGVVGIAMLAVLMVLPSGRRALLDLLHGAQILWRSRAFS